MEQRGRNRWQRFSSRNAENRLNYRQTVATGCHRLPFRSHGKEGVDGSSPSEGSARARRRRFPVQVDLLVRERAVRTEPSMVLGVQNRVARRALELAGVAGPSSSSSSRASRSSALAPTVRRRGAGTRLPSPGSVSRDR